MGLPKEFIDMLPGTGELFSYVGQDQFGNSVFDDPQPIRLFVGSIDYQMGQQDGHHKQDPVINSDGTEITTDYYGIKIKDKVRVDGLTDDMFVTGTTVFTGFKGEALYQSITVSLIEKG